MTSAVDQGRLDSVLPLIRRVSVIEAASYLVLLVATVMKRAGVTELGVSIVGPIHGVLFLLFAYLLLRHRAVLGWPLWRTIVAVFLGSLPFGGFWLDQRWLALLERSVES